MSPVSSVYWPPGQVRQLLCPVRCWNCPLGQTSQDSSRGRSAPLFGLKRPAAHRRHHRWPVDGSYVPVRHDRQVLELDCPLRELCVPAGQLLQPLCADNDWYSPNPHSLHEVRWWFEWLWNRPGEQSKQKLPNGSTSSRSPWPQYVSDETGVTNATRAASKSVATVKVLWLHLYDRKLNCAAMFRFSRFREVDVSKINHTRRSKIGRAHV